MARKNVNDIKVSIEWYEEGLKGLAAKALQMRERSNLGQRFLERTFTNFNASRDPQAYNKCFRYANREDLFRKGRKEDEEKERVKLAYESMNVGSIPMFRNNLIILGGYGSGKTHLAAAVANEMMDKGVMTMFGTFSEHLESIRAEFDSPGKRQHLDFLKNVPMLVIDDLGKEKKTEWSSQILFDVINHRYERYLPSVITTNFDMTGFANHVGGAVASRLMETSEIVQTKGSDFRDERTR